MLAPSVRIKKTAKKKKLIKIDVEDIAAKSGV
jgi:hypothetical protein